MEDNRVMAMILGLVLLTAVAGLVVSLSSSNTGMYSVYPQLPGNEVINQPDPDTQYVVLDVGLCNIVRNNYASFMSFVQRQCTKLNPGRITGMADCRYKAQLDAQLQCLSIPMYVNSQATNLVV